MAEKSFFELVPATFDDDGVQVSSAIGSDGLEYPDPVPMEPPIGYKKPPDILDMIRSMVRNEQVLRLQEAAGYESFDEADDLEVDDDPLDPLTPYEKVFEPPPKQPAAAVVDASKPGVSVDSEPKTSVQSNPVVEGSDKPPQIPKVEK